jgi:hypothetical protein
MPTDNPKISAYVPKIVYDRFEQLRKESSGVSMSQLATIIFAKYFGLDDIAKGITGEITVDDSALDRIKALESHVNDLFKKLGELQSEFGSKPPLSIVVETEVKEKREDVPNDSLNELPVQKVETLPLSLDGLQGELLGEPSIQIPAISDTLLAKRLLTKKGGPIGTSNFRVKKERSSTEDFFAWTIHTDPDNIGWECDAKTRLCTPDKNLSDELKSKLLKWIQENS